jgi:formylglycine-generating enzyme required for sulfatase activity
MRRQLLLLGLTTFVLSSCLTKPSASIPADSVGELVDTSGVPDMTDVGNGPDLADTGKDSKVDGPLDTGSGDGAAPDSDAAGTDAVPVDSDPDAPNADLEPQDILKDLQDAGTVEVILDTGVQEDLADAASDASDVTADAGTDAGTADVADVPVQPPCEPKCNDQREDCLEVQAGKWACVARTIAVPAGNFWMGCNNCSGSTVADSECAPYEHSYHEVVLDAYGIDMTEVTADQYAACAAAGGCAQAGTDYPECTWQKAGLGSHPINCVNLDAAKKYCAWVGKTLCTEAQWEKAARGGCEMNPAVPNCKATSRKYPWGNDPATCNLANIDGCPGNTEPVCTHSPAGDSPYGLCDMAGNLAEWTADIMGGDYYCKGDGADVWPPLSTCSACGLWPGYPAPWSNPKGPPSGSYPVVRGGGYASAAASTRVSARASFEAQFGYFDRGFRCCSK